MRVVTVTFLFVATFSNFVNADCGIVPIEEWAGEPSRRKEVLVNPVPLVVIQHTVTPTYSTDEECKNMFKSIREYHTETLKFDDIGESFLVCGNGKIYEGAGWQRVGAHTGGYNKNSIGVAFLGDYTSNVSTPEALKAVQNLLECGVENKHLKSDYTLVGHRQIKDTISPGDGLQKEIETWSHWKNITKWLKY